MKSNAPGQLLGFTLQYPRALYHLLTCGPGDSVCIEVLGDVAVLGKGGNVITEEDKSSTVGNPLTDRSTDFWKTFSNWIDAVNTGDLCVENTRFLLFCNKSGKESIVTLFSLAMSDAEAEVAIVNAQKILADITSEHPIFKYLESALNKNVNVLKAIIPKFELQIGSGGGQEEVLYELKCQHVADTQIEFMSEKIGGWLQTKILEYLSLKKPAIIKWEDFDHEFKVVIERIRGRELIDFALGYYSDNGTIHKHVKERPRYIKQLEAVDCDDDEILAAVTDYLRAKVNIEKWIEDEIIDLEIAIDFEKKLIAFWKNKWTNISLTQKILNEKEQGKLLYSECKSRQEHIRDMSPPSSTVEGTYHALANKPLLGWHPQWLKLFPSEEVE